MRARRFLVDNSHHSDQMCWYLSCTVILGVFLIPIIHCQDECPAGHYGPGCKGTCKCDKLGSSGCHKVTGRCLCKPGFRGTFCNIDIDECHDGDVTPCLEQYTYCQNTPGSYKCLCMMGYTLSVNGNCQQCHWNSYGPGCLKTCSCKAENTVTCELSTGECICKPGWEGMRCEISINDCLSDPCPDQTCTDLHRAYVCICGDNKRMYHGTCQDAIVEFISFNLNPALGDLVDIFFLFSLGSAYQSNPLSPPNFIYKMQAEDEESAQFETCDIDFHRDYSYVKGKEWFIQRFNSRTTYHFYIHFVLRFMKPEMVTVKAVPGIIEYVEKVLVFDVRYKDVDIGHCLVNLQLPGTGLYLTQRKEYKRQRYNLFEVKLSPEAVCKDFPRLEWIYFKMEEEYIKNPKRCMRHEDLALVDINSLLAKSGAIPITDQKGKKDIIPKNTLPLGIYFICAVAFIQKKLELKSVVCGYIEIVPAYELIGRINPPYKKVDWVSGQRLTLSADYHLPDYPELTPKFEWTCKGEGRKRCPGRPEGKQFVFPDNYGNYVKFTVKLKVTVPGVNELVVNDEVEVNYVNVNTGLWNELTCLQGCGKVVGTHQDIMYKVLIEKRRKDLRGQEIYEWNVQENDRWLSGAEVGNLRTDVKHTNIFYVRPRRLKPGTKYILQCILTIPRRGRQSEKKGSLEIEFRTEAAPVGQGCHVGPTSGKAILTRFTFACVDYKDTVNQQPLMYRLYQEDVLDTGEKMFTVIAYSGEFSLENITLTSSFAKGKQSTQVKLKMEISNIYGTSTDIDLTVQLEVEDQKQLLSKVAEALSTLTQGTQEDIRTANDIATLISFNDSASYEEKRAVRQMLLRAIRNYHASTPESVEHVSFVLMKAVFRENELEEDGLDSGLVAAKHFSDKLASACTDNSDVISQVAKVQVHALSTLLSKTSESGKTLVADAKMEGDEKTNKLRANLNHGFLATASVEQIAEVLQSSLAAEDETVELNTEFVDLTVAWQNLSEESQFNYSSKNGLVNFLLPGSEVGAENDERVDTEFELYKKNPYVGAADNVHGDLPVLNVKFVRHKKEGGKEPGSTVQFSKPADIFIDFNSSAGEVIDYHVAVATETLKGITYIRRSGCIMMSVQRSTTEATILKINPPGNLKLKVKAKFSNVISAFENLHDEEMLEMPLNDVESINSTAGLLTRENNLLILPMLTMAQAKKKVQFYRIKIKVKLHQRLELPTLRQADLEPDDCDLNETEANFNTHNLTVQITPYRASCLHFDKDKHKFVSDQCMLSMFSNLHHLHCQCVVAAAFTGSVVIVPKLINPLDVGLFLQIFENPLVVSMVIAIWMIFVAGVLYGRRKDKQDDIKRGVTVLDDNRVNQTYVYLVCVVTGWSTSSSTTSNVFIIIKGSLALSDTHILKDDTRRLFEAGAENWFVLTTASDLGEILTVSVWTDFSGGHPSWFLNSVFVQNMQTQESWFCLYNSWLSVDRGVGNLMADIPAMKEHVYAGKRNLQFFSRANNDMRNEHLWFGVIAKTSYNRFTRVQRLLTGLTMLQCLMIFNLIFFETIDPDDAEQFIQVFEQKIHLTSIIIGIETSIIMSIIGFLLVIMFNKIAPKPHKNKNDELTEEEKEMFQTKMEREKYVAENRVVLDLPVHSPKQSSEESAEVASDWAESEEVDESDNATNRNFNAGSSSVDDELEISEALLKQRLAETVVNVPSDQDKDISPENAKTFMLPWWFLIIAWVILGSFNLFLAYYIMLYGLSFGYELSVDWALAFFSGFFTNVFIVQPVKVILIVFVFVLIFKQTYTLKEKAPLAKLNEGLHLVNQKNFINEKYGSPSTKAIYQVPLNVAEAEQILKRLKIEHDAKEMLRDLVLYLVFMVCILSVVHGHLDVYLRYRQIKFTKEVYLGVREPLHSWDAGESLLADVREVEDMWDYIIDYLILPLVADDHEKMSPDSSYLIGPARLRQARVEPDTSGCLGIPENIRDIYGLEFCSLSMKNGVEEKRSFEGTWENPSNLTKVDMEDSPYVYRTAEELKTASFRGYFSKYTGGGYVAILSRKDYKSCKTSLEKLRRKDWIDQHTRCVFVEFTLYNPSSDLFTHVVIAFEFDVTGGLFPHYHVNSARFYLGEKRKERWLVLAEGVTFVCLLFYTAVQFNAIYMSGFYGYIKNYWNIIEVIVLLLSYVAVCLYYLRLIAFTDALDLLNKFGHAYFIDFHTVFYRNFDFHVVMGFLAAFVIVKLVKVVTFNPFLIIFLRTMEVITPGIFGYSIISLLLLISLAALGNLLFGSKVIGYMTIGRSFYSLLFFILGEANYVYMSTLVDVLWPFYFLMVMFITQYLVLNFFMAILREGLERTKLQEFTEESETVKYMIQSIVRLLGLSRKNRRKL